MKDLKEKVLIIALILLFSFWYLYTGYLVFDYFTIGWPLYLIGILILLVIIAACLHTVKRMKNGEY